MHSELRIILLSRSNYSACSWNNNLSRSRSYTGYPRSYVGLRNGTLYNLSKLCAYNMLRNVSCTYMYMCKLPLNTIYFSPCCPRSGQSVTPACFSSPRMNPNNTDSLWHITADSTVCASIMKIFYRFLKYFCVKFPSTC